MNSQDILTIWIFHIRLIDVLSLFSIVFYMGYMSKK